MANDAIKLKTWDKLPILEYPCVQLKKLQELF